jgi:hypothetical protein
MVAAGSKGEEAEKNRDEGDRDDLHSHPSFCRSGITCLAARDHRTSVSRASGRP